MPDTPLGKMYKEHIDLILKKDVEALLNQYTDDAILISSFSDDRKPKYYRGRTSFANTSRESWRCRVSKWISPSGARRKTPS